MLAVAAVNCVSCCPPSLSKTKATTGQSREVKADQKEWILEQEHLDEGQVTVYLTTDAVKIMAPYSCSQVMAQGPDWKVHCINLRDKTEWIGDMSEFSGTCMVNPFAQPKLKERQDLHATGVVKMSGLTCIKNEQASHPNFRIYTTKDLDVNPKCAELLDRYYYLNHLPNVPICESLFKGKTADVHQDWVDHHVLADLRQGNVVSLSTKSCRQKPFNAADFAVPQHCRRMAHLIEVTYTKKKKNDVSELLDSIGFSSEGRHTSEIDQKSPISKTAK